MIVEHWIAPGLYAGAEQMVVGGVAALRSMGVDATIVGIRELRRPEFAATFERRAHERDIPVTWIDAAGRADAGLVRALHARLQSRPDVIHTHGAKATTLAGLVRAAAHGARASRGPAWVATHHGATSSDRRMRVYERLLMRAYRAADAVVAVSSVTGELLARQGIPTAKLHVVENLLPRPDLPAARRSLGATIELLFIGRLSPEKGLAPLFHAFAAARPSLNATLEIVGDGPERATLEALSQQLGLEEAVRWSGYVPDVTAALLRADALVLPSLREGLPLTLVEALVSGLPTLASAVGGIPEVLPPGAGLLVPAGDARSWTRALSELPTTLPSMQAAAYASSAVMRARFSPMRWAEETVAVYRLPVVRLA